MPRRKHTSNVGAAFARLNAVQHGLTAETPVIPGVESAEEWLAHHDAIVKDLRPAGAMEMALVERIARLAWRLWRVDRYECASVAAARERVEFDFAVRRARLGEGATSVADARVRLEAARRCLKLLEHLRDVPTATPLASADVEQVLGDLADAADELVEDYLNGIDVADDDAPWTAGRLIAVLKAVAARDGEDFAVQLVSAVTRARALASGCERDLAEVSAEIDRMRSERLLPDGPTLERIVRYETALNRMFYQAVNELEAAQARRAGVAAPLHRLQAFGLPGG
jgi:hypothetical protein